MSFMSPIDDFDAASRNGGRCSLSNLGKQGGKKRRQSLTDDFILRGPMIDMEGFFDVRPTIIKEIALAYCDVVEEAHLSAAMSQIEACLEDVATLTAERDDLQEQVDALARTLAARVNDDTLVDL